MSLEASIADHYGEGGLLSAIEAGLREMGKRPGEVGIEDLAAVDEFHIGGRQATMELGERLAIEPGTSLVDVGCGIGGPARFFASTFGCNVTGIDLTPEFVDIARALTDWTGLAGRARFVAGSALAMPFADASFDRATQLHVGMNIEDKRALFREVHRVLRPGGTFGVYDIARIGDGDISYPVPWSSVAATSFVEPLAAYREALAEAGFVVTHERVRHEFALAFFADLEARMAQSERPPPLGVHVHMGSAAPRKIANMVAAVRAGVIAPVEMIAASREPG